MSQIETPSESISRQNRPQLPALSGPVSMGSYTPEAGETHEFSSRGHSNDLSSIEQEIERRLLHIGIPPHVKGFPYIREAVKMLLECEEKIFGITKILYPDIARLHDTTSTRVERAIRHAIELSWSRNGASAKYLFAGRQDKPSNAEFLAYVSRSISLNMLR